MTVLWTAVLSSVGVLIFGVAGNALSDEARGRLDRLPHTLLRLAGRRLPHDVRDDLTDEWEAELGAILAQAAGLPITRLVVGTRYSLGLLRVAPRVAGELTGAAPSGLPLRAWVYVVGVVSSAAVVIGTSSAGAPWRIVAPLAVLFVVCESYCLNSGSVRVSSGYAAGLASVVLLGPAGAALVGVTGVLSEQRSFAPVKRLFNGAQFALSGYVAGVVFQALHHAPNQPGQPEWLEHTIGPFLGALFAFVSVNLLLVAGILFLGKQAVWRDLLRLVNVVVVGCVGYGMTGLLIAGLWGEIGMAAAPLVLLPLVVARRAMTRAHHQYQTHSAVVAVLQGDHARREQDDAEPLCVPSDLAIRAKRAASRCWTVWRNIDPARLLLTALTGLVVLGAVTMMAASHLTQPKVALVFGGMIVVGELLRIAMPGNREVAPIATAGALSYALLDAVGGKPALHSSMQVVAVTAVAMLLGSLPHIAGGRPLRLDAMAQRLLIVSVAAACFRPVRSLDLPWPELLTVMCVAVTVSCLADVLLAALIRVKAVRVRFGVALHDEIAAKLGLYTATGVVAMVLALATSLIGLPALLLFTAPILVTHMAFRRLVRTHAVCLETVRTLAQEIEAGKHVETEHSLRVAKLAVETGRELGMTDEELLELEYAALLHDIGQRSPDEPTNTTRSWWRR
jgi:hypothetical protein